MRARTKGAALRAGLGLMCLALALAACAGGPEPEEGLARLLGELGFSLAEASSDPPAQVFKKSLKGLTLWAALPLNPRKGGAVLLLKATGPQGALSAATDQALGQRPEIARLVEAASQGAYPPAAFKEIWAQTLAGAAQPPGSGSVATSPKQGFTLTLPFSQGHVRLVVVARPGAAP